MTTSVTKVDLRDFLVECIRGYKYHDRECPTCGDPAVEPDGDEEFEDATQFRCIECGQLFSAHEAGGVVVRKLIEEA